MTPHKTYKRIRLKAGWANTIADEFGWEWSNLLCEYDSWINSEVKKINTEREKKLKVTENNFIDEFLDKKNAQWARERRIEHLKIKKPDSVELKMLLNPKKTKGITDLDIQKAKKFPIPHILGEHKRGKYNCIWHEDENPSMQYYEKTNTVHCFSCKQSGDAIDVYQKENNCDFKEAVKNLS